MLHPFINTTWIETGHRIHPRMHEYRSEYFQHNNRCFVLANVSRETAIGREEKEAYNLVDALQYSLVKWMPF